ncbi:hypothetical protein [Luteimonas vadosa]|uniref:Uncharacterized protein n=1 Tax=Luteimonas vadosa TaxID=1165507 RepID=A0ABP9DWC3_9GAMM
MRIAGYFSERSLDDPFGPTDTQAKASFKQLLAVRMDPSGSAQFRRFAKLGFECRSVGR